MNRTALAISGRLSLREPQADSLRRLAVALESVPALRDTRARGADELAAMIAALKPQFPNLGDFERDFPSLCFALATGVGNQGPSSLAPRSESAWSSMWFSG